MRLHAHALLLLALAVPARRVPLAGQDGAAPSAPPGVGTVAKPVEPVNWLHPGVDGRVPKIVELRGQVVLVHTWGYYCDPCMRVAVPYVVDLMKAQKSNGLRAYSITVPIGDGKPRDHCVKVGLDVGIQHPLGDSDGFGEMSPYVNMNVNQGLTWCFVIGREGGVRWAGDPSVDGEEFLAAVKKALLEEPMPPLPEGLPAALDDAVRLYVAGELARAADEAAKVGARHARKGDEDGAAAIRSAADELVGSINGYRQGLMTRLAAALERRDAEEYLASRRSLLERFPGTEEARRAADLDRQAKRDAGFRAELDRWTEWDDLRREAHVLLPARVDAEKRFLKKLKSYVEGADETAPGLEEAKRWLEGASDA